MANISPRRQTKSLATVSHEIFSCHPLSRTISLKHTAMTITWTKTEYHLFQCFQHGQPLTYHALSQWLYQTPLDPWIRTTLDKHIDRMRRKFRGTGVSIYNILEYGYILLQEMPEGPPEHASLPAVLPKRP
jgi:DNA-binding response OmpR family regulator